jgi:hypothetical protein
MVEAKSRNSCRGLFKRLDILPVTGEHIFPSLNLMVNTNECLPANQSVHTINTISAYHVHRLPADILGISDVHMMLACITTFNSLLCRCDRCD